MGSFDPDRQTAFIIGIRDCQKFTWRLQVQTSNQKYQILKNDIIFQQKGIYVRDYEDKNVEIKWLSGIHNISKYLIS